jgi:cephalosporin-C deacetylase
MPCLDFPLSELQAYTGTNPRPADFDDYWKRALAELDATDPKPQLTLWDGIQPKNSEVFDLTFTGVGGARIYAKYVRPKHAASPHPAILEFHGYTGHSGDWMDKLRFSGEGVAVASMDCRGQGGRSEDPGGTKGNTHHGHIIRGLSEGPEKLLFRNIFLDTVQLARVVASFDEVDQSRLACTGGSQGGALSIACAALEPRIRRCVSIYPFLSDYKRVWNMDLVKDAYAELKAYMRMFDPLAVNREKIFETLGYIDVHHLAPRIQADVVMALTLQDAICPPSTQYAVFNNLRSKKTSVVYPDFGHEHLPGFADSVFHFLTFTAASAE